MLAGKIMEEIAWNDDGRGVQVGRVKWIYGVPSSTFQRHVNGMVKAGLIIKQSHGKYSLGYLFGGHHNEKGENNE